MTTEDAVALRECPFCGPKSDESGQFPQLFKHESECLIEWSIRCGCCGIELGDEDREQAIAAWNTRVTKQQHGDEGWQPIATAPRDGRQYLGYQATDGDYERQFRVCKWWHGCHWALESGLMPTHWRPLPEPPALQSNVGE